MPEPQAVATHEGLDILTLTFPFSRGTRPSACYAEAIPVSGYSGKPGDLKLSYGDFSRTFKGCAVDWSEQRIQRGRKTNLRIVDRRWKWQYPIINYRANIPGKDGEVRLDTKRTPTQIALAIFSALGETNYDTTDLPSNIFPFVDWDGIKARDALDELLYLCGCTIVLGSDDRFYICRLGDGEELPSNSVSLTEVYPFQAAAVPKDLQIRTGELLVQSKFLLRAIAPEFSGTWDNLSSLSYAPTNGWEYETPYAFYNVGGQFYDRDNNLQYGSSLALQYAFRVFHIWEQAHGGLGVPGLSDEITSMEQISLRDTLNDFMIDIDGIERAGPAYVEGIFWPGSDNYANTPIGTRYHGRFTIDKERGYVIFDEPVVALSSSYTHSEPVLYLTTSYTVRPKLLAPPNRYQRYRTINDNGEGRLGIDRRDITPRITQRYSNITALSSRDTNIGKMDATINSQLDSIEKAYKPQPAKDVTYGGWINCELDGLISQITWRMGPRLETRITRWHEHWPSPGGRNAT